MVGNRFRWIVCVLALGFNGVSVQAEIEGKYGRVDEEDGGKRTTYRVKIATNDDEKLTLDGGAGNVAVSPDFWVSSLREKEGTYWGIFEDSFGNKGVLSVSETKEGIRLWMFVTDKVEPRPMGFYGEQLLKRTE